MRLSRILSLSISGLGACLALWGVFTRLPDLGSRGPASACLPGIPLPQTHLELQWASPTHPFLQGAHFELLQLTAQGKKIVPAFQGKTASLELGIGDRLGLRVSFTPSLEHPLTHQPTPSTVLSLQQEWNVVHDRACRVIRLQGPAHPLLQLHYSGGGVTFQIDTSLVDLTELWYSFASVKISDGFGSANGAPDQVHAYESGAADPHWRKLRILGYTGGQPQIWPVYIPSALQADAPPSASTEVGRIAFFKFNEFFYWKMNTGLSAPWLGMWLMNQLLLPGRALSEEERDSEELYRNVIHESRRWEFPDTQTHAGWLRAGLADSLEKSGKKALLVLPWREAGADDHSIDAHLSGVTGKIVHFLDAQGRLATHGQAEAGKLVIAGFSGGGGTAQRAFRNNSSAVSELYLMDPVDASSVPDGGVRTSLSRWFKSRPDARLRVVSTTEAWTTWRDLNRALGGTHPGAAGNATLLPEVAGDLGPALSEQLVDAPDMTPSEHWFYAHQFTLNGGTGSYKKGDFEPYFLKFLLQSGL